MLCRFSTAVTEQIKKNNINHRPPGYASWTPLQVPLLNSTGLEIPAVQLEVLFTSEYYCI